MSVTQVETEKLPIGATLEAISAGEIALPDFQRDFDWGERDIRALVATVLLGWPAGSLMLVRGRPDFFTVRPFDGVDQTSDHIRFAVLDGQQRLTALHRALHDVGPFVYAIRLSEVDPYDVDDIEESIVSIPRADWNAKYRENFAAMQRDGFVPLYSLRSASDFFEWRDEATQGRKGGEVWASTLTKRYRSFLSRVHEYQFPTVFIDRSVRPDAIARIFERINKSGLKLGAFDLMVARSYAPKWNLREAWNATTDTFPMLSDFLGDDGLPVLQVIALHHRGDVRQSAVLALGPEEIRDNWEAAANAIKAAIDWLRDAVGVDAPDVLPYRAQLIVLATLVFEGHSLSEHGDIIAAWFWASSFGAFFDTASNTKTVAEYQALARGLNGESQSALAAVDSAELQRATRRANGAIYRAFLSVNRWSLSRMKKKAERDFVTKHVRSLVAVSVFRREAEDAELNYARVLGHALVPRELAGRVRRLGFVQAMREWSEAHTAGIIDAFLHAQGLPEVSRLSSTLKNPSRLLRQRAEFVAKTLRR